MVEAELSRVAVFAVEAVNLTALRVRRIVGLLHTAAGRAKREAADLAWDYQELAGRVRWSTRRSSVVTDDGGAATEHSGHIAEVISIDLRRRQAN